MALAVGTFAGVSAFLNRHDGPSYSAGREAGEAYADDAIASLKYGSERSGTKDDIANNCELLTRNEARSSNVYWSGGVISSDRFDKDSFEDGCRDAASDILRR